MKETHANPIDTGAVLADTVTTLRTLLQSMEMHGDGEHASTVQDVARIATALVTACAELRQHSKARKRELAAFSVEALIDRIKELPDAVRQRVADEVTGAHDEEALL